MRSEILLCFHALLAIDALENQPELPHIFLVVADDLGWNDVPWHNPDIQAPFIGGLASEGIKLTDYHLYKVCSPSRASLMTGRYPNRVGLHDFIGHQSPEAVSKKYSTLAQTLRDGGYETHMVGKWHLGYWGWDYIPTGRGFNSFFGYMGGAEDYYDHTHSGCNKAPSGPGYASLDLALTFPNKTLFSQPQFKGVYANDVWAPYAKRLIASHPKNKPLFLFFPIQHVHEPLQVPDAFKKPYLNLTHKLPDDRITLMGMVAAMDKAISDVVDAMKQHGLWENTLTIFTTDNGGNLGMGGNNYPLRGGKFTFWEGGTRGAGFVHSVSTTLVPKKKRGTSFSGLLHVADWYATICEVAGLKAPISAIDSISQWQSLHGKVAPQRTQIVHETVMENGKLTAGKLRSTKWNLYYGNLGKKFNGWYFQNGTHVAGKDCSDTCLFDVEADASEHHDVASDNPEVVKELLGKMKLEAKCPDGMCDLDVYNGTNKACDAFDVYGAYGPWDDIHPPATSATFV